MPPVIPDTPDARAIREVLQSQDGRISWRALDRVVDTPAFDAFVLRHTPSISPLLAGTGRRRILQVMAASFAMGGLSGCNRSGNSGTEEIVPYVRQPTSLTPTEPQSYASATLLDGIANGALITTIDGRPIKVEGNPDHPWTRGGTDAFAQASVLGLYDPDRSGTVMHLSSPSDWDTFRASMKAPFDALKGVRGRGLRLLTGPVSSPALIAGIQRMQRELPEMRWHVHAPAGRGSIYEAANQVFGKPLETLWDFSKADVVLSLDGDFLDPGPQQAGASRRWIDARRKALASGKLPFMHAVAPVPTLTFAKADDHQPIAQRELLTFAEALLAEVSGSGGNTDAPRPEWRRLVGNRLKAARGRGIVLAGTYQTPELHAVVHRLNAVLGNTGTTILHTDPAVAQSEPFDNLVEDLARGDVTVLLMLDANPVYSAPGSFKFSEAMSRVPLKVHAGLYQDETALRCDWHVPLTHPLESWGDARSPDGTATLIQPTISPLYNGRSAIEILSLLRDPEPRRGYDLLRAYWRGRLQGSDFELAWREALKAGFVAGSASPVQQVTPNQNAPQQRLPAGSGITALFRPDPTVWDGAFANNGWLQELPKPWTKTVWQNVITIAPALAAKHGLSNGDLATLQAGDASLTGPIWTVAGQSDDCVMLQFGYGRGNAGSVAGHAGYNAFAFQQAEAAWRRDGVTLRPANGMRRIVTAQELELQEGHDIVRTQVIGAAPVGDNHAFTQPTLYNRTAEDAKDARAWGMVIDLDACTGCNACVVACQAENNIPVVGESEFAAGRDMHWLRVDHYRSGPPENPDRSFMPVPCMHCETAPCEPGCPVEATVHDREGLNLMVYNRCVGTRACSSYCPYKVRHFNFLHYSEAPPAIQARRNPDVTVRARGVMEKCTYCVQRIVKGRITADIEHRPIRDGEVITACAAACPTQAIVFGDLADASSAVAAARKDPRNYALLGELNTRPRTTYLARYKSSERKA